MKFIYFCTHSFNKQQMDKNNKISLLTGASSGIGYDTAVALAKQGHKVYAAARRVERMEPLRERGVVPLLSSNHKNDSAFNTRMPLSFSSGERGSIVTTYLG